MGNCTAFLVCRRACVPCCTVCDRLLHSLAKRDEYYWWTSWIELNWLEIRLELIIYDCHASDGGGCICRRFILIFCLLMFDFFWWLGNFDETWYFCWFLDFPLELGGSDGTFCYWAGFYEDLRTPFRFIVKIRWWSFLNLFWVLVISFWDGSIDGSWRFCWDFVWNFYFILTAASAKAAEFFLWLSYKLRVSGRRLRCFDMTFWALISGFLVGIDFDWDSFLRRGRFYVIVGVLLFNSCCRSPSACVFGAWVIDLRKRMFWVWPVSLEPLEGS